MKRVTPSLRRLFSIVAALSFGVLAALFLASPASAHDDKVTGSACKTTAGTWQVTWTVENDYKTDATLDQFTASAPGDIVETNGTKIGLGTVIPAYKQIIGIQILPGTTTTAPKLTVHSVWKDDGYDKEDPHTASARLNKDCTPAPVGFTSTCAGTVTVNLPLNPYKDVTYTVITTKHRTRVTVAKNTTPAPITIPADEASSITVKVGKNTLATGHFEQPTTCETPTAKAISDCTSLSVTVTNPAGNATITAVIKAGDTSETVTVPAGTTSAPVKFPVTSTPFTATVTIGKVVLTGTYSKPASCSPSPAPSSTVVAGGGGGGGLPVTGVNTVAIAGVALVLIGGGAALMIITRRRRAAE